MQESDNIIDDFLTFEKLNYANWKSWKTDEIQAIENYFLALFEDTLQNKHLSIYQLENMICLISNYSKTDEVSKVFKNINFTTIISNIVDIILSNKNVKELTIFIDFFSRKTILNELEKSFFNTKDKLEATRLSIAYTVLENYKN